MSYEVDTIDRDALPTALQPTVKSHCRVDFSDDDAILTVYTQVAIGQLEKVWDLQIFGTTGKWIPLPADASGWTGEVPSRFATPVQPAFDFTATDKDGFDNSTFFRLVNKGSVSTPTYLETKDGTPFPAGTIVTLKAGYTTQGQMQPEALGAVLQVTGRLYEYRESVQGFTLNQMPMWMNDLLVGLWVPRC